MAITDPDYWLNDSLVTSNHVLLFSRVFDQSWGREEVFARIGELCIPIKTWLNEQNLNDKVSFDYRACKDMYTISYRVNVYIIFRNQEDRVMFTMCQENILNCIQDF